MTKADFTKMMNGKNGSRKFIEDNKNQINKYISAVMKSEDNMIGYLSFSTEHLNP